MANMGSQSVAYSFLTTTDLSAKQYFLVKLSANNTVALCAATTDIPIGVLQNKPVANQTAEVLIVGITKVSASATIAAGAQLTTSNGGQAVAAVAGTDTTRYVVGTVIDASNGANSYLTAVVDCIGANRAA